MTIEIIILIAQILFAHWIADFIFQAESWSLGKSKNLKDLLKHTTTYSIVLTMYLVIFWQNFNVTNALLFCLITFICHTITDYFTSKVVKKRFEEKHYGSSIPNFGAFTLIGFDQILHYSQLFITYHYIYE